MLGIIHITEFFFERAENNSNMGEKGFKSIYFPAYSRKNRPHIQLKHFEMKISQKAIMSGITCYDCKTCIFDTIYHPSNVMM